MTPQEQAAKAINDKLDAMKAEIGEKAGADVIDALKSEIQAMGEQSISKEAFDTEVDALKDIIQEQGKKLQGFKLTDQGVKSQINKFIEDNHAKIKDIKKSGSGIIRLDVKAPEAITTGSATNPAPGIPESVGVYLATPENVNLRRTFVDSLVTVLTTTMPAYAYTDTLPKEGDFEIVPEGEIKPQIDFSIETRYAEPRKIAAHHVLTDEAVQDIPNLQSIANDYLRRKHDLKRQNLILFGDGVGDNPFGATTYGRTFNVGAMAASVVNPNFMDMVNAASTDIYTTHNYVDEMSYMPTVVLLNPVDFFTQFTAAKDGDGKPLYPTARLFNQVNVGGMTIIPERSIPVGKIFIGDMSRYNITNYIGYTVSIGWINDQFIRNQFTMLGESRFHQFVRELDKVAFIYDDIATIKTSIQA